MIAGSILREGIARRTDGAMYVTIADDLSFYLPLNDLGAGAVNTAVGYSAGDGTPTFTRATTATTVLSNGLIGTVASGVARSCYSPSGVYLGYLSEPQSTNLCLQSSDLSSGSWAKTATVTADSAVAPDGTTTADTLTDNSSVSAQSANQNITVANDSLARTFSVYVEKTGAPTVYPAVVISYNGGTALSYGVVVNTQTGVITNNIAGAGAGITSSIADWGSYWRVSVTGANNSTGNVTATPTLFPAWNTTGNAGSDATAQGSNIFWGMQVEVGLLSSYIPTAGVAVTRNGDGLTYAASGNVLASAMTSYAEVVAFSPAANQRIYGVNDGTVNNRNLDVFLSNASTLGGFGNNSGVQQFLITLSGVTANTSFKAAAVAATNNANLYLNGVAGTQDTSVSPPSSPTVIEIGSLIGGNQLGGCIKNLKFWSRVLSDAQVAGL